MKTSRVVLRRALLLTLCLDASRRATGHSSKAVQDASYEASKILNASAHMRKPHERSILAPRCASVPLPPGGTCGASSQDLLAGSMWSSQRLSAYDAWNDMYGQAMAYGGRRRLLNVFSEGQAAMKHRQRGTLNESCAALERLLADGLGVGTYGVDWSRVQARRHPSRPADLLDDPDVQRVLPLLVGEPTKAAWSLKQQVRITWPHARHGGHCSVHATSQRKDCCNVCVVCAECAYVFCVCGLCVLCVYVAGEQAEVAAARARGPHHVDVRPTAEAGRAVRRQGARSAIPAARSPRRATPHSLPTAPCVCAAGASTILGPRTLRRT